MIYHIIVKPNSRKSPPVAETADGLVVHVRAKAVDGAANKELIETLAEYFGVPKTRVVIRRGGASRYKTIEIIT
jgi:uncharacterized protein (TIGR00251 family)